MDTKTKTVVEEIPLRDNELGCFPNEAIHQEQKEPPDRKTPPAVVFSLYAGIAQTLLSISDTHIVDYWDCFFFLTKQPSRCKNMPEKINKIGRRFRGTITTFLGISPDWGSLPARKRAAVRVAAHIFALSLFNTSMKTYPSLAAIQIENYGEDKMKIPPNKWKALPPFPQKQALGKRWERRNSGIAPCIS